MIRNGRERDSPLIAVAPETSIWRSSRNIRSASAEQSIRILLRRRSFAELWSQWVFLAREEFLVVSFRALTRRVLRNAFCVCKLESFSPKIMCVRSRRRFIEMKCCSRDPRPQVFLVGQCRAFFLAR